MGRINIIPTQLTIFLHPNSGLFSRTFKIKLRFWLSVWSPKFCRKPLPYCALLCSSRYLCINCIVIVSFNLTVVCLKSVKPDICSLYWRVTIIELDPVFDFCDWAESTAADDGWEIISQSVKKHLELAKDNLIIV